jgi:hypothetical protein
MNAVDLSTRIYRALLVAYPREFREEYGPHMVQTFRTACVVRSRGTLRAGLLSFWLRSTCDLLLSAALERTARPGARWNPAGRTPIALAFLIAAVTGVLDLWADADMMTATLLFGGTYLCGALSARRPWRWALLAGIGIPCALLVGHAMASSTFVRHEGDFPFPAPMAVAYLGAYAWAVTRRLLLGGPVAPRRQSGHSS